jgi:hypothetical protein
MERYRAQFAEELGVSPEDVTVRVEKTKHLEKEPSRRVLRYHLPDGRMGYCDPIAAVTTMFLPDPTPHGGV